MKRETIFEKEGQEVVLCECCKVIDGSLKTHCIEETGQYFSNEKRAIRAAHDLLLRKTLSKYRYQQRKKDKRRRIGANRIANTYRCYVETKEFVVRWDGELYLETKKNLIKEMSEKLDLMCKEYEFENAQVAVGFLKRIR